MTNFSSKCWNRFFSKDKSILVPCRKQRRMRMLIAFYFTRYVVLEVSSFLLSCLGPLAQLIMFCHVIFLQNFLAGSASNVGAWRLEQQAQALYLAAKSNTASHFANHWLMQQVNLTYASDFRPRL